MNEAVFDHENLGVYLIQRTESISEGSIEYEYEYRDAEYEYEEMPEPRNGNKSFIPGDVPPPRNRRSVLR